MTGTFTERIAELRDRTGCREGSLRGSVKVDQVYAHAQEVHLEYRHPRGGQALYLQTALMRGFRGYLASIASSLLDDGGRDAMRRSMEHMSNQVEVLAPVEFADLRRSGHPRVEQGARTIYDRAPRVHRLSEAELRAKARLRKLPPELLGWIYWHMTERGRAGIPPPRGSRWAGA